MQSYHWQTVGEEPNFHRCAIRELMSLPTVCEKCYFDKVKVFTSPSVLCGITILKQ